ncbi:MAG: GGDEF domain-containing protein [Bacilli bacterium]|nr:GGDEF domain-containing protein [Bacilli bacterium]
MKKFKRIFITILSIIIIVSLGLFIFYNYFYDENKLSIKEKQWIADNKNNLIDINISNKLNIFGYNGAGVFFDFLDALEKEYLIKFNKTAQDNNTLGNDLGFYIAKNITSRDLPIYKDYYVVIGKNSDVITSFNDLTGSIIGITADTLTRVTNSYKNVITYTTLDTREALLDALDTDKVNYLIVPKNEYLDLIIEKNYKIVYHLSDLPINYFLRLGDEETLNSIILKYYHYWIENEYESIYYDYAYNLFVDKLNLTQAETDTLTNKNYIYGFVSSTPYQTLASSNYGGIAVNYLDYFSKLSDVEFTLTKYKNSEKLIKDFNNKKIDLIFADTNINASHNKIFTNLNIKYNIIAPLEKDLNISNINDLTNDKVMVLENSKLYSFLNTVPEITLETVSNEKKLLKETRKDSIVAIDANTYDYYVNREINDYKIIFTGFTTENFNFQYVNNNDAFYKLFNSYVNIIDNKNIINEGLANYKIAAKSGNIITIIAQYTLIFITGVIIMGLIMYFSKSRLKLDTKIRKDEKLKFIDLLTSLKNRNYLNEKKDVWNNNTMYPQGVIIMDLNNVKYLNDTFGHLEGDKQIKAAANILIKTQLDNTEVIRTDGNEFMVYLVGYSEKQVLNYVKKLVKEFKELPYEYGAAIGFSMIVDDLKLIDDAINEATIQMRENKENIEAQNEKEI